MDLTPSAYDGLKRRASRLAHSAPAGTGPETVSLFHRALLRFRPDQLPTLADRDHFFRSWSCAMRSALLDLHRAAKHRRTEALGDDAAVAGEQSAVLHEREQADRLDALLAELAQMDGDAARIVHLRYFEELTWHEIAGQLGWSYGAVQRKWTSAKAWLRLQLKSSAPGLAAEDGDLPPA